MNKTEKEPKLNLNRFIRNRKVVWYGPHECNGCGATVVKSSIESGAIALDAPHGHHYPNHKWMKHVCTAPEKPENKIQDTPNPPKQ